VHRGTRGARRSPSRGGAAGIRGSGAAGATATAGTAAATAQLAAKHLSGEILEDIYASADYRKAMAIVFLKRALTTAFSRAA
jgi:CO/xanthine dehydrogenase FAD-binding subunit